MAKKQGVIQPILNFVVWLAGILVSLAVGFGMIQGELTIPWLTSIGAGIVTVVAGWIVVVLTILGVILAIANK